MKNAWMEALAGRLQAVNEEIAGWPEQHGAEALTRRPRPNSWSAAECMEHVAITAEFYARAAAKALDAAEKVPFAGEFAPRYSLIGRLELLVLNPKFGLKMKAPGSLVPGNGGNVAGIAHCIAVHEDLLALMEKSDGLDLSRVRFLNPIVRVLRMNLGESFPILTLHAERHLAQAQRALGEV